MKTNLFIIFVQEWSKADESCDMFLFSKKYLVIPAIKHKISKHKQSNGLSSKSFYISIVNQ